MKRILARLILWLLFGLGLVLLLGCSMPRTTPVPVTSTASVTTTSAANATVNVWLTNTNLSQKLSPQAPILFGPDTGAEQASGVITIDPKVKYQRMVGFGASFTDSAAWLMYTKLTPAAREAAMRNLFDTTTGIGLNFIRQPMGASDLARAIYSYDDMPAGQSDLDLANFSIDHDRAYIIPMLQQAQSLNPNLVLMASPWSPPGWMKAGDTMLGGAGGPLRSDVYATYANYFVRYLQGYEAVGLHHNYVSIQNEPEIAPGNYPGLIFSQSEMSFFLKNHLLPALTANNLTTQVLLWDFNHDKPWVAQELLRDPALRNHPLVAGVAWHGYAGDERVMTTVHDEFPEKGTFGTELSGGTWVPNQVERDFRDFARYFRNWSNSFIKWSIALDQNRGPYVGGCNVCTGLITVDQNSGAVTYNKDYYTLGHLSKFIKPGAYRIDSTAVSGFPNVAFQNPDGSIVLVAYNDAHATNSLKVVWNGQAFLYTLEAQTGATFVWAAPYVAPQPTSVPPTPAITPTPAPYNAFSQIEAENYSSVWGLNKEMCLDTGGGYDLGSGDHGDYLVFNNVNFGAGATSVSVRLASGASYKGGQLEFRLDSLTGPLIGSLDLGYTGGWQRWATKTASLTPTSGMQNVYIVLKGGSNMTNFNWFKFK